VDSKMSALINAALDKTRAGGLAWKAFSEESFRTPVGTGYLHVRRIWIPAEDDDRDPTPEVRYSVQVSDARGRVVAEEDVPAHGPDGPGRLLTDLFGAARESALGTSQVLEEMLLALRGA